MSLFALASLKGAPGTTTLACLVAATWPLDRRVVVAECDPSGGDLAARFELLTTRGCLSLATAARRDPDSVVADPHIQRLPGGLEVLVGGSSSEMALAQSVTRANVNQAVVTIASTVDVVADLGRLAAPYDECRQLLQEANGVGVLIGPDRASVAHAIDQRELLSDLCGERISLMLVGRGACHPKDVESLTGIRVSAEIPNDPAAAAVASGASSGARRLARSVLVKSARRIADSFASVDDRSTRRTEQQAGWDNQAMQAHPSDQARRTAESTVTGTTDRTRQDDCDAVPRDEGPPTTLKVLP
jgi:MinD-like ATPase involved in chromosome partitioning or flagellar assembly